VLYEDRLAQRGGELALELLARGRGLEAAEVDAGDRDALRDLVLTRLVVGVDADRAQDEHCDGKSYDDERALTHSVRRTGENKLKAQSPFSQQTDGSAREFARRRYSRGPV
jgi:hypothetical protein